MVQEPNKVNVRLSLFRCIYIFKYIIDNQQLKYVQLIIYSHTVNSNNKIHVIYVYYTN